SREPVRGLVSPFPVIEHDIWQPCFHSPPDQPALTAVAQILILGNPEAKLKQTPVKCWGAQINAKVSPHVGKPVGCVTITVQVHNSGQSAVAIRLSVESQKFPCRSINNPASLSKFRMNCAKVIPGRISLATPLLVPTKERRWNNWREYMMTYPGLPSMRRP